MILSLRNNKRRTLCILLAQSPKKKKKESKKHLKHFIIQNANSVKKKKTEIDIRHILSQFV